MTGQEVISALKRKFEITSDRELAAKLGVTLALVQTWKNRETITSLQFARLVHSASRQAESDFQDKAIRPLVEFFPIEDCQSRYRANRVILDPKDENGMHHPYRGGLKKELEKRHGVYIFFDSRGEAIYVGKARRQSLWKEMNLAFNRERGELQKIKKVRHPEIRVEFKTSEEKS